MTQKNHSEFMDLDWENSEKTEWGYLLREKLRYYSNLTSKDVLELERGAVNLPNCFRHYLHTLF